MTPLIPLLFVGFLGALFVLYITRQVKIAYYPLFILSLAFPTGLSICSLLLFAAYLLNPHQARFISISMFMVLTAFFFVKLILLKPMRIDSQLPPELKRKWTDSIRHQWSTATIATRIGIALSLVLWVFTFVNFCHLFQSVSLNNIFGGWDARFFWNVKASFYFRSPEEWKNMFSAALSWAHPDYPLLLPGAVAWGWNWVGNELQIWPALIAFVFLFSIALLIAWYLSSSVHFISGLIASAFFMSIGIYSFWGVSQYADVPLAFFMTASGVILIEGLRSKSIRLFFLAGWLAGCSAWTKNEGLFFIGWVILISALFFVKNIKQHLNWKRCFIALASGIAIPFLAVFILKTTLAESGDYLGSGRGLNHYLQMIFMDWPKTKIILNGFRVFMFDSPSWNSLWVLFLTACIAHAFCRPAKKNDAGVIALLTGFILFGYFVVLHTSPHNIVFQIQTALDRLLLHAGGLALIFTFEAFGQMLPLKQSDASQATPK